MRVVTWRGASTSRALPGNRADARALDAGEDYTEFAAQFPTPPASAGLVTSGGFAQLSEEAFLRDFAGDLEPAKARILYAVQGQISDTLFSGKTTQAAWRSKPSWYAISTEDRTISPELQRFIAERMKAKKRRPAAERHGEDITRRIGRYPPRKGADMAE